MKKSVSLNRFIMICAVTVGVLLVAILFIANVIMISNYQRIQWETETKLLGDYGERYSETLKEYSLFVNDLSVNDLYFVELSRSRNVKSDYDNVYNLDMAMRNKIRTEEQMHGYFLFYQYGEEVRYYREDDIIPSEDMQQLKEFFKGIAYESMGHQQWRFTVVNSRLYGYRLCTQGQAAFCLVYSLEPLKEQILETSLSADNVFCVWEGKPLGGNEESEKYQVLTEAVGQHEYRFRLKIANEYVYAQRLENGSLWICMTVPISVFSYISLPQMVLVLFTCAFGCVVSLALKALGREIIAPLKEMTDVMERIRNGEWDARMKSQSQFQEIEYAGAAMDAMVSEIKKQKMLSYEQTIEKQRAQMQYLQLQLKPHFYLNGLKILNVFAMSGDKQKVQDLIMRLSFHLRYLLQVEQEQVALDAEIDYVKNYAELKADMDGRPFAVRWNISEITREWKIPTLCIQTFVENSFKYAKLGSAARELMIHIGIQELNTEEGVFLDIQVHDNGFGYPEEVLEEISESIKEGSRMVGINNIKRRCRLLYGEKAVFCFYNDGGAYSELMIPLLSGVDGDLRGE